MLTYEVWHLNTDQKFSQNEYLVNFYTPSEYSSPAPSTNATAGPIPKSIS